MFDIERISEWRGQDVLDPEGQRVGRLEEIYYDKQASNPGFACVKTGLFGRRLSFVPLVGASMARDHIRVAYDADQIKHAPSVEPDGQLTAHQEAALFDHYGLEPPVDPELQSPRLVRYQTEAAAAQVAQARQLVAEQGDDRHRDPAVAAAAMPEDGLGRPAPPPVVQVGEAGEVVGDPVAYAASAGAASTPEERMRHDRAAAAYPANVDADRLSALEERVAAIENWLSANGR